MGNEILSHKKLLNSIIIECFIYNNINNLSNNLNFDDLKIHDLNRININTVENKDENIVHFTYQQKENLRSLFLNITNKLLLNNQLQYYISILLNEKIISRLYGWNDWLYISLNNIDSIKKFICIPFIHKFENGN